MPHTICISLNPEERPLGKQVALLAIDPEDMVHTLMAAIARDIEAGVES